MPEVFVHVTSRDLITKVYVIRTEYWGRHRRNLAVYKIPDYILGEHLGTYLMQYGQLGSVTPEYETGSGGSN